MIAEGSESKRVVIPDHEDTRICERHRPLLASRAHEWVCQQVVDGRLASRSPGWHGRRRIGNPARRFVRTAVNGRGVLIVVERVACDVLRVVTIIVQSELAPTPSKCGGLTDKSIGKPITGGWPPATACYMPAAI